MVEQENKNDDQQPRVRACVGARYAPVGDLFCFPKSVLDADAELDPVPDLLQPSSQPSCPITYACCPWNDLPGAYRVSRLLPFVPDGSAPCTGPAVYIKRACHPATFFGMPRV